VGFGYELDQVLAMDFPTFQAVHGSALRSAYIDKLEVSHLLQAIVASAFGDPKKRDSRKPLKRLLDAWTKIAEARRSSQETEDSTPEKGGAAEFLSDFFGGKVPR